MDLLRCHTYLHSSFKCILQFCIKLKIGTYLLKCKWSRGEFKKLKDVCHEYQRFHWWRHQIKTSQISRNMWKRGRFLWSLFHYFTRPWQSPCDVNYVKMALNFRSRQIVFLHLHHSVIISHIVTIDKNTKSGSF